MPRPIDQCFDFTSIIVEIVLFFYQNVRNTIVPAPGEACLAPTEQCNKLSDKTVACMRKIWYNIR